MKLKMCYHLSSRHPGVAQLVARLTGGQEAVGSSPATRTIAVKAIDTIVSVALTFFYALKSLYSKCFS